VRLIGASLEAINKAEDRQLFKSAMERIGLATPRSGYAQSVEEAELIVESIGFPAILRRVLLWVAREAALPTTERNLKHWFVSVSKPVQIQPYWLRSLSRVERSSSWRSFATQKDNVVIVCSIENIDPMGVHTGDS